MKNTTKKIKNNKKAIFFDIDGTLFDPIIGVPKSTREGISKLRSNGILTIVCTGRSRSMVPQSILELGFDGIIAGAGTYVEYKGEKIFERNLPDKIAQNMVTVIREHGLIPLPEGHKISYYDGTVEDKEYKEVLEKYFKEAKACMDPIPEDYSHLNIAKISARFTKNGRNEELIKKCQEEFTIINHSGLLLEFIPKYSSKAVGIKAFIEHAGVNLENTYAFGDSMNDFEMLTYVNYGVAMGNSDPQMLPLIKYKTDSIENDGIYNALKRFELI